MNDALDDEAPLSARLLFERIIHAIRSEQTWVDGVRKRITEGAAAT